MSRTGRAVSAWSVLGLLLASGCSAPEESASDLLGSALPEASVTSGDAAVSLPNNLIGDSGSANNSLLAVPPAVCKVLQDNACLSCHSSPTQGGAPMPLRLQADFMGLGQRVLARVQDTQKPMPPASTGRSLMPSADVAVLKSWVEGGMQGVQGSPCDAPTTNTNTDPNATPSWATAPWPAESECEYVLTVGAHGANGTPLANDKTGYAVPTGTTSYHCFYEKVPWGDKKVQALAIRAKVESEDDKALVHHLVLSGIASTDKTSLAGGTPTAGGHGDCPNPSGSTVGVWAPGALNPVSYPSDVGVLMPSGNSFIELQVHYNNTKNAGGKQSRVSYEICATSKLRPQTAGVHWLGYENADQSIPLSSVGLGELLSPRLDNKNNGTAVGVCKAKQRARVLWMAPHMHELGRHAKVEVVRKDGKVETLHDKPFDFEEQTAYFRNELWIEQGETMRTTCTWDTSRKIYFGFGSQEEMCFVYTLAYPVGALAADPDSAEDGVVGGNLACAGQGG